MQQHRRAVVLWLLVFATSAAESSSEQREAQLSPMLAVDWKRLHDLPPQGPTHSGFQDSDGGWLLNRSVVVTAFGYGAGGQPGFFNSAWAFNMTSQDWARLPDAPVSGRQEVAATPVGDDSLVYVGGFNYDPPQWTYPDVLRLTVDEASRWRWDVLPPFPHPIMSAGVTSIGSTVYVVGGADYDGQHFYNLNNRSGGIPRLGSRMFSLDTGNSSAVWVEQPQLPGPPRWVHSVTAVKDKIYVIGGGVTTPGGTTYTVVDSWVYDPTVAAWDRLPDLPVASGNFQTNGRGAFMDRYILLVGGYPYGGVYALNGSIVPSYGQAKQLCPAGEQSPAQCRKGCNTKTAAKPGGSEYYNDIWAFDTEKRLFGTVISTSKQDPYLLPQGCSGFPMNDNLPQTHMGGDKVFVAGGECDPRSIGSELYTHYPQLALEGTISLI